MMEGTYKTKKIVVLVLLVGLIPGALFIWWGLKGLYKNCRMVICDIWSMFNSLPLK